MVFCKSNESDSTPNRSCLIQSRTLPETEMEMKDFGPETKMEIEGFVANLFGTLYFHNFLILFAFSGNI